MTIGNNTVYTYYDPIGSPEWEIPLLMLWRDSWKAQGWNPVVLFLDTVMEYPGWKELDDKFVAIPTINKWDYELSCYRRWEAMSVVGGGWMCDYDVINYSFRPNDQLWYDTKYILCASAERKPCLMKGTKEQYDAMVRIFASTPHEIADEIDGKPHLSDQLILWKSARMDDTLTVCSDYGSDTWKITPCVHYPNTALTNPRWKKIPSLRHL